MLEYDCLAETRQQYFLKICHTVIGTLLKYDRGLNKSNF